MRLRSGLAAVLLATLAAGCTNGPDEGRDDSRAESPESGPPTDGLPDKDSDEDMELVDDVAAPKAHPAFSAHFTDAFYEDLGLESAPFGSDEGFDMLFIWDERRDELGPESTVADVLEGDPTEYIDHNDYDSAIAVQSAGFTLLRLTGQIDPAGLEATITALDQLAAIFGDDPVWLEQRRDLVAWRG